MDELSDVSARAHEVLEQAYAHRDRDELHDALRTCDAALVLDPGLAEAHNLRGMLLEELGRGREALAAYREAIRLDPDLVEAQENLCEAEEEIGEQEEASSVPAETALPPGERLSWGQAWIRVLTQPSVETFEALLRDPQASAKRAYTWVFFGALIGNLLSWCGVILVNRGNVDALNAASEYWGGSLLCAPPQALMVGLGAILGLAIRAGITHWIACALGGTGKFSRLAYASAAYIAPLAILTGLVSGIPYVGFLVFPFALSEIVLNVIAVKAVHRFGWWKAIGASLLPAMLLMIPVTVIAILLLLGPVIGDIFSNIVESV
jgi:tetratricopeptide (TPR) repeat protein